MEILKKIKLDALTRMSWVKSKATNLFIEERTMKKGQDIMAGHQRIPIKEDTVMVFADEAPYLNWAHPCRYYLYDEKKGELYDEVQAKFPPYLTEPPGTYRAVHLPMPLAPDWAYLKQVMMVAERWREKVRGPFRLANEVTRYAILFSGSSNYRHVNDLEFLYRTLIDVYHFPPENIHVLNYNGAINYSGGPKPVGNWPGDDTPYRIQVNDQGTKVGFENAIDSLKNHIDSNDFLFIHTNNHGGHNTESYLCTYGTGPDYLASDFAAKLSELPRFSQLMVMMEQCHSGGFETQVINNSPADETSFAAACEEDRSSTAGDLIFDPFARDWISAVNGLDPYGAALSFDPDIIDDNNISASEAYNYADTEKDPYDTPVYEEAPMGCGDDMYLGELETITILDILDKYKIERYIPYEEIFERLPPPREPELMRILASQRASRIFSERLGRYQEKYSKRM
jgi:hypothetical protein